MPVTSRFTASERISAGTTVHPFRRDDALLQESQPLRRLKGRAGRIRSHDGTVEERFQRIVFQQQMVLAALPSDEQIRIVTRRRGQAKHFARRRFDHDDAPEFVMQQLLGIDLQLDVDRQFQVFSRNGRHVVQSFFVTTFDTPVRIAQQDLHPFFASQHFLVRTFHSGTGNVIGCDELPL